MFSCLRDTEFSYSSVDGYSSYLQHQMFKPHKYVASFWKDIVIICLCVLCVSLVSERVFESWENRDQKMVEDYNLTSGDVRWRQFQWYSNTYSSAGSRDKEAVNAAWDRIVPAHGIVAVKHQWAADHNLPDSMSLPSDLSKGVYIIDAYHQLHCLTIIRRTLMDFVAGHTPRKPVEHSQHCFDSLLQYIICGNSGDTLLYTWGRNQTGDGQLRRCIDWNSRKDWAELNTACYKDGDQPIPLYDHFDHCDNNDDGLEV